MCDHGIEAEGAKALAAKFKRKLLQIVDLDYNEVAQVVRAKALVTKPWMRMRLQPLFAITALALALL